MNVFENLIDELKEENLIENRVMENRLPDEGVAVSKEPTQEPVPKNETECKTETWDSKVNPCFHTDNSEVVLPFNENDFYRRRAMEEVSSLQMVERVFTGVERELLKIIPNPYDDIQVSKALHDFLQISKNPGNPENAAAEFKLMQETENWYSALSRRDQNILPVQLRRYCETTRPVLSAQALAGLARFYRNSPFSEVVRSKFDLVATRLFTREIGNEKRELAFSINEIVQHLSELYADWSSVSVYSTDDDSQLTIFSLKFEDFITEAACAENFEELIKNDFFNRLRAFKVSTRENFYSPQVAATAIKCNVFVGNRFVELLNQEKENNNTEQIEEKYNFLLDQSVSDAASKTLQLIELLKNREIEEDIPVVNEVREIKENKEIKKNKKQKIEIEFLEFERVESKEEAAVSFFQFGYGINKLLLGLLGLTILICLGLYTWVEFAIPHASTSEVSSLNADDFNFKEFIKVGKIFNNTLIAVASPQWNDISEGKKREVLMNLLSVGKEKGYRNVHLLNKDGKTVGYISADSIKENNKQ